jgi:hypothetical protein
MKQLPKRNTQIRDRLIAYLLLLSVCVISTILLVIWLFSGFTATKYEFIEFYTCQKAGDTEQITEFTPEIEGIYICGETAANGLVQGTIHIYLENELIYSDWFSYRQGPFAHEIRYPKGFQPGEYLVNFYADRRVRAQTTFRVTVNTSQQ